MSTELSLPTDLQTIVDDAHFEIWPILRQLALGTTTGKDLDLAQSAQFVLALQGLDKDGVIQRDADGTERPNLVLQLRDILTALNAKVDEEWAQLPEDVKQTLRRQIDNILTELHPFDHPLPLGLCILWGGVNYGCAVWETVIALLGPDAAHIPRTLASEARSVFLFFQYLSSPTANSWQLLDQTIQRTLVPTPSRVAYTITFFAAIYKKGGYAPITGGVSMAVVAAVIFCKLHPNLRNSRVLKKYINSLPPLPETGGDSQDANLRSDIVVSVEGLERTHRLINNVARRFKLGNATSGQLTRLNSATQKLISSMRSIEKRKIEKASHDKIHLLSKSGVTTLGGGLAGGVLVTSKDNPILLVSSMPWAGFYTYRLAESTADAAHIPEDTLEIFCNAGAVMLASIPLVTVPTQRQGPRIFNEDKELLIRNTALLVTFNLTVVHHVGPAGLLALGLKRGQMGLI